MSQRIVCVDSFTNRAFAGNPAAVCLLGSPASDRWMQHVAAEMNLSETAFVHPDEEQGVYRLRWFTPSVEVDLCGHATLAAAHVLWEEKLLGAADPARFQTRSGRLTAIRRGDWIELDFPAEPSRTTIDDPAELERISLALNAPVVSACRNRFDLLVELADEPTGAQACARTSAGSPGFRFEESSPPACHRLPSSISSRGSSHRRSASMKTLSAARHTASWLRSGLRGWAGTRSPHTRSQTAAAW